MPTDNGGQRGTIADSSQLFIDRFGRLHTAAVLQNWRAAAIAALRVVPVNEPRKETPSVTER